MESVSAGRCMCPRSGTSRSIKPSTQSAWDEMHFARCPPTKIFGCGSMHSKRRSRTIRRVVFAQCLLWECSEPPTLAPSMTSARYDALPTAKVCGCMWTPPMAAACCSRMSGRCEIGDSNWSTRSPSIPTNGSMLHSMPGPCSLRIRTGSPHHLESSLHTSRTNSTKPTSAISITCTVSSSRGGSAA